MGIVNGMVAGGIGGYGEGVWIPEENRVVVATSIDILNTEELVIGYVSNVSPRQTQNHTIIRHLSAVDAGRPIELVPGVPEYTVSVQGFYLYNDESGAQNTLVNRLVAGAENPGTISSLAQLREYFHIGIRASHPAAATGRGGVWWLRYCRITSWDMGTFNIEGALAVQQSCDIMCLAIEWEDVAEPIEPYQA